MNKSLPICRLTNHNPYTIDEFQIETDIICFDFLRYVFHDFEPGAVNITLPIVDEQLKRELHNDVLYNKWKDCSRAAKECCENVLSKPVVMNEPYCEPVWDGWSCHSATKIGQISQPRCPNYQIQDTCHTILGNVNFQCTLNGTWYRNSHEYEWADYTKCYEPTIRLKDRMIDLNIVCNFLSLVFLLSGLFVFFSYRKLRVNRITIHKHFFVSLALHSLMQIIWEIVYMKDLLHNQDQSLVDKNNFTCVISGLLLHYTRITNYFWMFNESFYLFMLLIAVFKDQSNLNIYYFFGWGVPFIICSIYTLLSLIYENNGCWVSSRTGLDKILVIPNVAILFINFIFLIVIIRLLYKALKSSKKTEIDQYKKSFKATIILVPLFGLHYFLSPVILCESSPLANLYNIFNKILENLQGCFVSLLFCFLNNEVKQLIKMSIKSKLKSISIRDLTTTITFNRNEISQPTEYETNTRHNSLRKESCQLNNSDERLLQS